MNAAIRAVTRQAIHNGYTVYGIERGFLGIINREIRELGPRDVGGIITSGGTVLKTARFPEFKEVAMQEKAYSVLQDMGIESLIVIGGDGSMAGAEALSRLGLNTMTIPATIDNDMNGTEYTIGFDTAINTVVDAVGKIRDTSNSHERIAIVEVMGRHAGHIALQSGLACGAEIVIIPEVEISLDAVCNRINESHQMGKEFSIILVAEGTYGGQAVKDYIKSHTYFDPSLTVLGYLQRGGSPSAFDSLLAARMSSAALEAIAKGEKNQILGYIEGRIKAIPYEVACNYKFPLDISQYTLLTTLSR
ncbi:ATP-dependent 6-phosphofructokinase [Veillonella caviae]|uniref:ATP-dependent 6-phosphofructokinase n=1 Tax=Veillonella caviae TaxID=248316 RepID=UPI0023A903B3|nr:ATP-dependent 6-phosphofructokinase [Veillonella caviae]MCI5708434.1 6-phosphofructokinase [Veillonella caviae]MDY5715712.1 ATP-dependent 6-phosphofructokinase [Veillonella caviae]